MRTRYDVRKASVCVQREWRRTLALGWLSYAPLSTQVQYDALFKEDENFEAGPFLYMYRLQYLQERREFLLEVTRMSNFLVCSSTP